jgi:hypothetical protein
MLGVNSMLYNLLAFALSGAFAALVISADWWGQAWTYDLTIAMKKYVTASSC